MLSIAFSFQRLLCTFLHVKLYVGANCEVNIDECAKQPCMHDGECTDLVNDFKCTCDVFYTGKRCQHMIDDCASQPCQNGGSCVDMEGGFTCNCRPGFVGRFLLPHITIFFL